MQSAGQAPPEQPHRPDHITYTADVDPSRVLRAATVAQSVDGPFERPNEPVECTACTDAYSATYRLRTATASWQLGIAIGPDTHALTHVELKPDGLHPGAARHSGS